VKERQKSKPPGDAWSSSSVLLPVPSLVLTFDDFCSAFEDIPAPPPARRRRPEEVVRDRRRFLERCFGVFRVASANAESSRRVSIVEIFGGLALASPGPGYARIAFACSLLDADGDGKLNRAELSMAMVGASRGLARLRDSAVPKQDVVSSIAREAFLHRQNSNDASTDLVSFAEVGAFCQYNALCKSFLRGDARAVAADAMSLLARRLALREELTNIEHEIKLEQNSAVSISPAAPILGDAARMTVETRRLQTLARRLGLDHVLGESASASNVGQTSTVSTDPGTQLQLLAEINRALGSPTDTSKLSHVKALERSVSAAARSLEAQKARRAQRQVDALREQARMRREKANGNYGVGDNASFSKKSRFSLGAAPADGHTLSPPERSATAINQSLSPEESKLALKWTSLVAEASASGTHSVVPAVQCVDGSARMRLGVDELEDLVEAAGLFILDCDAERVLTGRDCTSSACNLKLDPLGRASLPSVLDWFRVWSKTSSPTAGAPQSRWRVGAVQVVSTAAKYVWHPLTSLLKRMTERHLASSYKRPPLLARECRLRFTANIEGGGSDSGKVGDAAAFEQAFIQVDVDGSAESGPAVGLLRDRDGVDMVMWLDFALRFEAEESDEEKADKAASAAADLDSLVQQFLGHIPRDYLVSFRDASVSAVMESSSADGARRGVPRHLLRVAMFFCISSEFSAREPMARLAKALKSIRLRVEFCKSPCELLREQMLWAGDWRRRLFGPQEAELPSDLLDPVAFAHHALGRLQGEASMLGRVDTLEGTALSEALCSRGLSNTGTRHDMRCRLRASIEASLALGLGGLSGAGENAVKAIFRLADEDGDGSLNHSEMLTLARLLSRPDLPPSLASDMEYGQVLQDLGVHTDIYGRLTERGLLAFYSTRLNQGLVDDVQQVGLGSLDYLTQAKAVLTANLDPQAVYLLGNEILHAHKELQRWIKKATSALVHSQELRMDWQFKRISDCLPPFEALSGIRKFLGEPGWLANAIQRCQAWLADGTEGVLPSMRACGRDEEVHAPAAGEAARFAEQGTLSRIETLQSDLLQLDALLNGGGVSGMTPSEKSELEAERESCMHELDLLRMCLEAAERAACASFALCYDHFRGRVCAVAGGGLGTFEGSARLTLKGFDLIMPAGEGEPAALRSEMESAQMRAELRQQAALNAIEAEKAECVRREQELAARIAADHERAQREEREGVIGMFQRGLAARTLMKERPHEGSIALRLWSTLLERVSDDNNILVKFSVFVRAAALNNLGLLLAELSQEDPTYIGRGAKALRSARDVMLAEVKSGERADGGAANAALCKVVSNLLFVLRLQGPPVDRDAENFVLDLRAQALQVHGTHCSDDTADGLCEGLSILTFKEDCLWWEDEEKIQEGEEEQECTKGMDSLDGNGTVSAAPNKMKRAEDPAAAEARRRRQKVRQARREAQQKRKQLKCRISAGGA
jgi:hypothetical protein